MLPEEQPSFCRALQAVGSVNTSRTSIFVSGWTKATAADETCHFWDTCAYTSTSLFLGVSSSSVKDIEEGGRRRRRNMCIVLGACR